MINEELWVKRLNEAHRRVCKPQQLVWSSIRRINIEPTTLCNASCIVCDHDNYIKRFGHRELPADDVKDFMYQVSEFAKQFGGIKKINFGVYGESLMYADIVELVKYASSVSEDVRISTNLSLLDGEMSKSLLEAGLSDICFSIDECEKERFEKIRRGMVWETILENAKTFKKIRDEGDYKCRIIVSPVICDENKDRVKDIVNFWQSTLNVRVRPSPETPIGKLVSRVQPWFDVVGKPHCSDMFTIKSNGNVVPCCLDIYEEAVLGNMYDDSPSDIFHGYRLKEFREKLSTLKDIPHCCKICTFLPQLQPNRVGLLDRVMGRGKVILRHINNLLAVPRK